jgi:poly-gamma-glutamate capsule biosynthesis protein CapA/YwtB (metallophosphatase superfamily)
VNVLEIVLLGDTMLGRGVGEQLAEQPARPICSPAVAAAIAAADLVVANLECCISARGERWPDPGKPFFFRAPPSAATTLADLGVDVVTLANNHTLDFGEVALRDTLAHLDAAGIAHVGAGPDVAAARRPAVVERGGTRVAVVSLSDHPADYAAGPGQAGIAYADLVRGVPPWVGEAVATAPAELVLVCPHWGPNLVTEPVPHVRRAAAVLARSGAAAIVGTSAHVLQGVAVEGRCVVLHDLGGFVDDYAVDPLLRNDLGGLWRLTVEDGAAVHLGVLPLHLAYGFTGLAEGPDRRWVAARLRRAVAPLGVDDTGEWLRIPLR